MSITIEEIETKHAEVLTLINKFKEQAAMRVVSFIKQNIDLAPGEEYAGIILTSEGTLSHHLILLPGEKTDVNWKDAMKWAESIGGELPTRNEQSLLFANLKNHFQSTWYWSNTQHASDSTTAWYQRFYDGHQDYLSKSAEWRARAVRRLSIL